MEKRAVIEPGRTPPEHKEKAAGVKTAMDQIVELDSDFRKRAAETVIKSAK
jgi:hypothetical protein